MLDLDKTLEYTEAKIPRVVNEPSSDNEEWNWDWDRDAQALINKFGWAGLAKACAYYDPDASDKKENGYPAVKKAYYLPHHKLIDGEITLVWGGVRAAMQRLLQTWSRVLKGDVESKIDFEGAYKHLASHYKYFGKEVPEKPTEKKASEGTLRQFERYQDVVEFMHELDSEDVYAMMENMIVNWFNEAEYILIDSLWSDLLADGGQSFERMADSLEVFDALKDKVANLMRLMMEEMHKSKTQGGSEMEEKDKLSQAEGEGVVNENIEQELASVKAELEAVKQELERVKAEKKKIEAEYAEFKAQIEAEKEAARKKELASQRLAELKEAGVKFTEEREVKVLARLAEMSEEDYAEYKADLIEAAGSLTKVKEDKADASVIDEFGEEDEEVINNEMTHSKAALEIRKRRVALNIEYQPDKSLLEKYEALVNSL